ncbi:MAG: M48 family metallopeptidase [Arenimonas sp.]
MKRLGLLTAAIVAIVGFSANLEARRQLLLVSDSQMNQLGTDAFEKLKSSDKLSSDKVKLARTECVVNALIAVLPEKQARQAWEVRVFEDESPNAFALPGGKVGVNTGMFKVVKSQDELAAVIGHEIAHVVSQHANERVSQQTLTGLVLQGAGSYADGKTSSNNSKLLMAGLGLSAQMGVLLPFSRKHETEADILGQKYMANAGFDPAKAVTLWQNMQAISKKGNPPKILSTHPNPGSRIQTLQQRIPGLMDNYQAARKSGMKPSCF